MQDKIIFITGASSGIGEASATIFAERGAKLILCARRSDRLKAIADKLQTEHGTDSLILTLDIQNNADVAQQISELPKAWQTIDVLINNAGCALGAESLQNANPSDWDIMIDTNIKGLLYITKAILPNMVQRDAGHIINLGSIAGHEVYPGGAVYCATKHAEKALSQGMKMDLLGSKIRVTSIDPGMVNTEFSTVRFKGDKTKADTVYQGMMPLVAADIADAIYYCASRPAHVNICDMVIFPTDQAAAKLVHRK